VLTKTSQKRSTRLLLKHIDVLVSFRWCKQNENSTHVHRNVSCQNLTASETNGKRIRNFIRALCADTNILREAMYFN